MKVEVKGIDVVAITAIVCFSVLIALGHNGTLIALLSTIVGWYFGRKSARG
ncbi:MAG: hypothetical protein QW794_04635 [Thermosphaera sp.]